MPLHHAAVAGRADVCLVVAHYGAALNHPDDLDCLICAIDCLIYAIDCLKCASDCLISAIACLLCAIDCLTSANFADASAPCGAGGARGRVPRGCPKP